MSSKPNDPSETAAGPESADAPADPTERRRNLALRKLIDEMLFQVRGMQKDQGTWSAEERAQAQEALDRIMGRVRQAATDAKKPGGNP